MIDQVILGTQSTTTSSTAVAETPNYMTTLTLKQLGQLKQDLDTAGKAKDLIQLETLWHQLQKAGQQIPTTMYNRLIRGFLSCPTMQGLAMAKQVVDSMETQQYRLPTTRTCTYMIQAYLKRQLPLEEARPYVTMLQHYSLNKLRTPFDCSVMLRYYVECGNAHAIDFLWRDTMRYIDVIQPGPALYTQYVEWLLSSEASLELVADAARSLVQRFERPSSDSAANDITTHTSWPDYQVATWLNVVRLLAHSNGSPSYCTDAEKLMLCLVNVNDTITAPTTLDNVTSPSTATPTEETALSSGNILALTRTRGKQAIQDIITVYLEQAQDLKVLAFYYRLRKSGVNEEAFSNDLTRAIGNVINRIEMQQEWNTTGSKAMADEFGLLSRS
ncbi:unnamed protein product [Absidia cylindrospora]